MLKGIIYKAHNINTNKDYCGRSSGKKNPLGARRSAHYVESRNLKDTRSFHVALRNSVKEDWIWITLETIEAAIKEELNIKLDEAERKWIELLDSFNNGYNLERGGNCATKSNETKLKMSKVRKGKRLKVPVKCVEHNIKFESCTAGAKYFNLNYQQVQNAVSRNCKGGGLTWEKLNPFEDMTALI